MKATEFRLNNLIQTNQGVFKISGIQNEGLWICPFLSNESFSPKFSDIQPIPLTEEWLLKFGLNQLSDDKASWYGETNDMKMFIFVPENDFYSSMFYVHKWDDVFYFAISTLDDGMESFERLAKIQHVHQLQNLYFALTNEELTIIS